MPDAADPTAGAACGIWLQRVSAVGSVASTVLVANSLWVEEPIKANEASFRLEVDQSLNHLEIDGRGGVGRRTTDASHCAQDASVADGPHGPHGPHP